jgi:hypothetical protein
MCFLEIKVVYICWMPFLPAGVFPTCGAVQCFQHNFHIVFSNRELESEDVTVSVCWSACCAQTISQVIPALVCAGPRWHRLSDVCTTGGLAVLYDMLQLTLCSDVITHKSAEAL